MKSKIILFSLVLCSFLFGGIGGYFVKDYLELKSSVVQNTTETKLHPTNLVRKPKAQFKDDPFAGMDDQMDQIHAQMRKRMKDFFQGDLLSGSFLQSRMPNMDQAGGLSVDQGEDERYKYIEVKAQGLDPDKLQINIENGMVSIEGEVKKTDENRGGNSISSSSYISHFSRSMSIPEGVDEAGVKIEKEDSKIVIKFPKHYI